MTQTSTQSLARWLNGPGVIAAAPAVALLIASASPTQPAEATSHLERLAAKLEQAKVIHSETTQTIIRILMQPSYDCEQAACSPAIQARNRAARFRLESILATRSVAQHATDDSTTTTVSRSSRSLVAGSGLGGRSPQVLNDCSQ